MFGLFSLDEKQKRRWRGLAEQAERVLVEQEITSGNPGTILQDVEVFLEFVGPKGLATRSRNGTFPLERVPELNQKVSHPIEVNPKRPLLRDYPNLAGIFILLRVMDLLQLRRSRLVVVEEARDLWRSLNPAEQYFALLEGILLRAEGSVLENRRWRQDLPTWRIVPVFLSGLSKRWHEFSSCESLYRLGRDGEMPAWRLFLLEQMGLIELRLRPRSEQEQWNRGSKGLLIGGAKLTVWGEAVTWVLLDLLPEFNPEQSAEEEASASDHSNREAAGEGEQLMIFPVSDSRPTEAGDGLVEFGSDNGESDDESEEDSEEEEFGSLQGFFEPYFPEWQKAYELQKGEVRSGTHVFKVSLIGWQGAGKSIWRRLAAPPNSTLDELARAILVAFGLDDDHLYDFRYRDGHGLNRVYNHPYTDEGPFTSQITVGAIDLPLKKAMHFNYDYGASWEFNVQLEKVEGEPSRLRKAKVIDSHGKAPEQYPDS